MRKILKDLVKCDFYPWSLFQRQGVYYADGRGNSPGLGKHSLGTRDRKMAIENLRHLDRKLATEYGLAKAPAPTNTINPLPIGEGWSDYIDWAGRSQVLGGVSAGTLKRYRAVRDKHTEFAKKRSIFDWIQVTRQHVEAYGQQLHVDDYSGASIYLECTLLKQIVKYFVDVSKVLPSSALIYMPLHRSEDSDTYCFAREQVASMIGLCRSDPSLGWLGDIITALAATGMRIGELAALRWSDVDLSSNVLAIKDNRFSAKAKQADAVRTTKGRRSRNVELHPELRALLATLARRPDGLIFSGHKGGVVDPDKVLLRFKRDVLQPLHGKFPTPPGEIGFKDAVIHSFRHYFVSEAFLAGASDGQVMAWVGHRDSRIVRRYRHIRPQSVSTIMPMIPVVTSFAGFGKGALPVMS